MWTREIIKEEAKERLRKDYWAPFIISMILTLAGARSSFNSSGNGIQWKSDLNFFTWQLFMTVVTFSIAFVIIRVVIGFLLEVGGRRFFIKASEGSIDFNHIGYGFREGRYTNIIKVMFFRGLYIFLWSLLLIIPGIIKAYAYRFVPYILAENPNISVDEALFLSEQITDGEKFEIFILDVSFMGWYLLGALAFGIGVFFVNPYVDSTNAELYKILKKKIA